MTQLSEGKFKIGDAIVVKRNQAGGNPRTPAYVRGKRGVIAAVHGIIENFRDHRGLYPPLYTVKFELEELFQQRGRDTVWVDVHEEWLQEP